MNFLAKILNRKPVHKELTVESAVTIFKNNKEKFEEFEEFYKNNILTEIADFLKRLKQISLSSNSKYYEKWV